jgi:hypothetical protein
LQTVLPGHTEPHAPQLFGSCVVSTQTSLHVVSPDGHAHVPFVQTRPFVHFVPHAPQSSGSDFRSTHAPLHAERPAPHDDAHAPALQSEVAPVHFVPHAPQLFGSFDVVAQRPPPQSFVPAPHTHLPPLHCWVALHAVAQSPQWSGADVTSTHALLQFVRGAVQPAAHRPRSQACPLHALPHPPQLFGSLFGSEHVLPHEI